MSRLIKRYGNRKLYDTDASRYVTLDGITDLVRAGQDLRIVDNDTGEDLTALTFAQIILEEEKRKRGLLDLPVLRWIIQQGGDRLQDLLHGMEQQVERGREAIEEVREFAEDGVRGLMKIADRGAAERGGRRSKQLLSELLELPQRQLEQLQKRIDQQVRSSVAVITKNPMLKKEIARMEESIRRIERKLGVDVAEAPKRRAKRRGQRK